MDEYSGAAAAYSLRLLNSNYTGDAIVVRRDSDNATANIGFVGGELNTTYLNEFCNGANGFVTTWFDQSGLNRNAVNVTASQQPKICDSINGIVLENGKPALEWITGQIIGLQVDFGQAYAQPNTFFVVHKKITSTGHLFDGSSSGTNRNLQFYNSLWAGTALNGAYPSSEMNKQNILTALFNTTNSESYINTQLQVSGNVGPYGLGGVTIGNSFGINSLTDTLKGTVQELIIYPNNQITNRTGIETNINDFYNIY